jgi:hypothetical protein
MRRPAALAIATALGIAAALAIAAVLALPAPALARGGDDVRVAGTCGAGAASSLRLRADDGTIRVEFELRGRRRGERWTVALVHERRVVWRGRARTRSGGARLRVRRSLPDFEGADQVGVRASGPRGNACEASAVIRG